MQYIQHNPERVAFKRDSKTLAKEVIRIDADNFTLKSDERPIFIAEYDNSKKQKGEKKFNLYWFNGTQYTKVPILGRFGMDEYQPGVNVGKSVVNGNIKKAPTSTIAMKQDVTKGDNSEDASPSVFDIESKNLNNIVTAIANAKSSAYSKLAGVLAPFAIDNIKVEIEVLPGRYGKYNRDSNTITISSAIVNDAELLAKTVLHEFIHALTINAVEPHIITGLGDEISIAPNAPAYVSGLVRLFNELRTGVDKGKLAEIEQRIKNKQALTSELNSKYYGYRNIREFMTMALTDKGFQEELNKIPYKQSGISFLERFKQIISEILDSLGVKFNKDFTAANAISLIFETIEKSNIKREENPYDNLGEGTQDLIDEADDLLPEVNDNQNPLLELAKKAALRDLPKYLKKLYYDNIEQGLKEIAAQLNSTESEAKTARELYGNTLSAIALKLYPNENKTEQKVSEYIKTLDSKDKKC